MADTFVQGDIQHIKKHIMTLSANIAQTDKRRGSEHLFLEGLSDLEPKRLRQGGTAEVGESLDVF